MCFAAQCMEKTRKQNHEHVRALIIPMYVLSAPRPDNSTPLNNEKTCMVLRISYFRYLITYLQLTTKQGTNRHKLSSEGLCVLQLANMEANEAKAVNRLLPPKIRARKLRKQNELELRDGNHHSWNEKLGGVRGPADDEFRRLRKITSNFPRTQNPLGHSGTGSEPVPGYFYVHMYTHPWLKLTSLIDNNCPVNKLRTPSRNFHKYKGRIW